MWLVRTPFFWGSSLFWASLSFVFTFGCEPFSEGGPAIEARAEGPAAGEASEAGEFRALREEPSRLLSAAEFAERYPWRNPADSWPEVATLRGAFGTPPGYERVELEEGGWEAFLRELPVRLDRSTVRSFDGRVLRSPAAAVALLPVGDRDLQQCADAVIRLRAEYLWRAGAREEIAFHFTSGDRSAWSDWAEGERFRVDGAEVERHRGGSRGSGRENFRAYLHHLFTYAGTRSLSSDARRVGADEAVRPGDFFLESGSPGHAVLVLDVAEGAEGERIALLGQSYIPAQEFHVLRDAKALGGAWFRLPDEPDDTLKTPSWRPFSRSQVWRFETGGPP